ncbi:DedA family protein [Devosia sp. A8/3-2]|nr:DedA family protein [Devosia sp. A8/3-2]
MSDATPQKIKFYDRLKLATKHQLAEPILGLLCFLEASILPIFPEIMLAPMIIADRKRAWRLATICTVTSVVGGLAGYAVGYFLFDTVGRAIIAFYGAGDGFASLMQSFNDNGPLMILIGAISPIPYKVVTITSGVAGLDLWTFIFYGLVGRAALFCALQAVLFLWAHRQPLHRKAQGAGGLGLGGADYYRLCRSPTAVPEIGRGRGGKRGGGDRSYAGGFDAGGIVPLTVP